MKSNDPAKVKIRILFPCLVLLTGAHPAAAQSRLDTAIGPANPKAHEPNAVFQPTIVLNCSDPNQGDGVKVYAVAAAVLPDPSGAACAYAPSENLPPACKVAGCGNGPLGNRTTRGHWQDDRCWDPKNHPDCEADDETFACSSCWWGLVTQRAAAGDPLYASPGPTDAVMGDPPLIQKNSQSCPGYYVNRTALEDRKAAIDDLARYVDSLTIPSLTVPCADIGKQCGTGTRKLSLGDVGSVAYVDPQSHAQTSQAFIVGNCSVGGPTAPSLFLAKMMGGAAGTAMVRCGSVSLEVWPRTPDDIRRQIQAYNGRCPKGCSAHGVCDRCACRCDPSGSDGTCYGGSDCGTEYCLARPQLAP